jgi:hypothetical protein
MTMVTAAMAAAVVVVVAAMSKLSLVAEKHLEQGGGGWQPPCAQMVANCVTSCQKLVGVCWMGQGRKWLLLYADSVVGLTTHAIRWLPCVMMAIVSTCTRSCGFWQSPWTAAEAAFTAQQTNTYNGCWPWSPLCQDGVMQYGTMAALNLATLHEARPST